MPAFYGLEQPGVNVMPNLMWLAQGVCQNILILRLLEEYVCVFCMLSVRSN